MANTGTSKFNKVIHSNKMEMINKNGLMFSEQSEERLPVNRTDQTATQK
jgi:hypothetical protein